MRKIISKMHLPLSVIAFIYAIILDGCFLHVMFTMLVGLFATFAGDLTILHDSMEKVRFLPVWMGAALVGIVIQGISIAATVYANKYKVKYNTASIILNILSGILFAGAAGIIIYIFLNQS